MSGPQEREESAVAEDESAADNDAGNEPPSAQPAGRLVGEDVGEHLRAAGDGTFEHDHLDVMPRQERLGQDPAVSGQGDSCRREDEGFCRCSRRNTPIGATTRQPMMPTTTAHMRRLAMMSHQLRPSLIVAVTIHTKAASSPNPMMRARTNVRTMCRVDEGIDTGRPRSNRCTTAAGE